MSEDDFSDKAAEIRTLASLPTEKFVEHLSRVHPDIDSVAPNIAPHIFSAATNAVQFLSSKLPGSGNELLQDKPMEPSQAQKKAWLDLHAIVNNPLSVLERVKDQSLTRHHLEALQSVYPDLHQEMVAKMQQQLGQMKLSGQILPYQKRVALSKFMGTPLDSTMTPAHMQGIIQSASMNTGPEAQTRQLGPKKASGVELKQINQVNKLYQTPLQALQANKKT